MTDEPERPRFSSAQIAMAGLGTAVVLIVIVIALALWESMSG